MARWWIMIAAGFIAVQFYGCNTDRKPDAIPFNKPPEAAATSKEQIRRFEASELYQQARAVDALATPGVYTVVAFTNAQCPLSRKLESSMPDFLASRQDVVFKSVSTFSGSRQFDSRAKMKAWQEQQSGIRERYDLDFSPRIFILNPDGSIRVGEQESGQASYRFLLDWIEQANST